MQLSPLTFTFVFLALLIASTLTRLALAARQIRHVHGHRHNVPDGYENAVGIDAHRKAADYTIAKTRLSMIEVGLHGALLVCWTLLGGLTALNQFLLTFLSPGLLQQVALVLCFALAANLVELPISWYQTFRLEQHFGFNKTTLKTWLLDGCKGTLVGAAIGVPVLSVVLWLMASAGSTWWAWAWVTFFSFNLLLMLIYPSFIAPLFNTFKPLENEAISSRVNALMARCGFRSKGFFVMDGSRRSAHANAYFTGFGSSKRVVFYDTLLNQLTPSEVEAVLAHELGHFHHRHILKRLVMMGLVSLLGFALLGWLSGQLGFYLGLGVIPDLLGGNEALALLLFLMVTPLISFFLSPVMAATSRQHEFEADAYAARQTPAHDLIAALLKLYRDNASTLTPDPWYVRFYYTHPPAAARLQHLSRMGGET